MKYNIILITVYYNDNKYMLRKNNESEYHDLVVTSVAKCSDRHYILPQISLPSSDVHYSLITVTCTHMENS